MARLSSFSRELQVMVSDALSPKARSAMIAQHARGILKEAQEDNRRALGRVPPHEQVVDRVPNAPLEAVNPDRGVIVFRFDLALDLFDYIGRLLVENSPVLTGAYQRSHQLYADGVPVERYDPARTVEEWVFASDLPYARKIERGQSDWAPDGVYEGAAALAARRYGNIAAIKFTYRNLTGARGKQAQLDRQPAISVRLR